MFWFFCSHASKLKITFSLCVTPDRRWYDRPLHLRNSATFSSTALFVMALYSSCLIIQSRFSIDPSKTNFPWMSNNSMQQRCSIAPPRFSVLQCLHLHPRRYKLVFTRASWVRKYISILLLKRKHSSSLRVELTHLLCQQESLPNQSGSSLSYSDGAIGSSVYGVDRDSITSVSFSLSVFPCKSMFSRVWRIWCIVSEALDK